MLKALLKSVETEYDRRIRAASNVRQYQVGGHGTHAADHHDQHVDDQIEHERLQGEGGATGELQANAGPQHNDSH